MAPEQIANQITLELTASRSEVLYTDFYLEVLDKVLLQTAFNIELPQGHGYTACPIDAIQDLEAFEASSEVGALVDVIGGEWYLLEIK